MKDFRDAVYVCCELVGLLNYTSIKSCVPGWLLEEATRLGQVINSVFFSGRLSSALRLAGFCFSVSFIGASIMFTHKGGKSAESLDEVWCTKSCGHVNSARPFILIRHVLGQHFPHNSSWQSWKYYPMMIHMHTHTFPGELDSKALHTHIFWWHILEMWNFAFCLVSLHELRIYILKANPDCAIGPGGASVAGLSQNPVDQR